MLLAQDSTGTQAEEALASICEAYWSPLYSFCRRQGVGPEDARDQTQAFFAYLLEKEVFRQLDPKAGRLRSFLMAAMTNFLSHERDKARACTARAASADRSSR